MCDPQDQAKDSKSTGVGHKAGGIYCGAHDLLWQQRWFGPDICIVYTVDIWFSMV